MIKNKHRILSAILFISSVLFVQAEKISLNTRHLINVYNENANSASLQKEFHIRKINNISYVNAYIRLDSVADTSVLSDWGVQLNSTIAGYTSARIPLQNLDSVSRLACVKYLQVGSQVKKRMNVARSVSNVDLVASGSGLSMPYTGKNVVIGIIDNGFQYDHINFYSSDGSTTRVKRVWDQNATGTAPYGFSYGAEYKTQTAIFSAKNDFTDETHATHVTGIAAGSDTNNGNTYYGVAPEADLILVSYNQNDNTTDNVSVTDGIKYIYNYADSIGKPCVVNMSLGSHFGPHDGTSAFDKICDALQTKGKLLVGSVGNEGSDKVHISKTFTNTTDTLKTFMSFYSTSTIYGMTDLWGDANKDFKIKIVVYNKSTGAITYSSSFVPAATSASYTYTLKSTTNGIGGKIYVYTERNSLNNKPNALVYADLTTLNTGYYLGMIITASDGSSVNGWADDSNAYLSGNSITGWTNGDANRSMGEIGGTGTKIISVGAYTSKASVTNINGSGLSAGETYGNRATFSSYGPTMDGRMKPDITAPGTILVSSFSSAVLTSSTYKDYFVKKNTVNGVDYYYGLMQGTSMSAPFVTGVLATWLQAKNDLTPDDVRSILKTNSITDAYTGTIDSSTGNKYWGWGKIDALSGIKACIALKTSTESVTAANNIMIYPNPCTDYLKILFSGDDSNVRIQVFNINGQAVMEQSIGSTTAAMESSVAISQLPQGIYLLKITGNKTYQSQRLIKK